MVLSPELAAASATAGASALAAVGWTVQLTHYPAFLDVPADRFGAFHRRHCDALGRIVPLAVLLEVGGAAALATAASASGWAVWAGLGLALFGLVWTFAVSAPLHGRLASGKDEAAIRRLIATNLPRTLAWTAHALLGLATLAGLV
ncbi:MAG: hypothetical protein SNJ74_07390 [Fimbriimonadaceae bacterium]